MLLAHEQVFDEIITGTGNTWYSSSEFDAMMGTGEVLKIYAVATDISGSPTVAVYHEPSCDNEHWDISGTADITTALDTNPVASTVVANLDGQGVASFNRLRIEMTVGSSSSQCRLQIWATARSF